MLFFLHSENLYDLVDLIDTKQRAGSIVGFVDDIKTQIPNPLQVYFVICFIIMLYFEEGGVVLCRG